MFVYEGAVWSNNLLSQTGAARVADATQLSYESSVVVPSKSFDGYVATYVRFNAVA